MAAEYLPVSVLRKNPLYSFFKTGISGPGLQDMRRRVLAVQRVKIGIDQRGVVVFLCHIFQRIVQSICQLFNGHGLQHHRKRSAVTGVI